ncbi:MAG: hypothetical protein EBY16_04085, partial [Gammaproteobacteria bacterium]|nr:hypothetical protein [Gammaproteobacteria bacterium]
LDHAKELGDPVPAMPVIFLKPPSVLKQASSWNEEIHLDFPSQDDAVQPECEIVIQMACDGYKMTHNEAKYAISSLTLGLDMTLRTRQSELKSLGHPWTTAKVFQNAAIIGPWIPYADFNDHMEITFELLIDGNIKQSAKGSDMMMHPVDLLVYISHFFPLKSGDIIYTGTPAGVSSIRKNSIAKLLWGMYSFGVKWI